jgi:TetR/AcrR family transcriptional repressor of lmrAB and yxaGH operons
MVPSTKAEAKRARIVNAARSLFSRKGFEETSLEDIGKDSSLGKASLYYYFPDGKESIFAAAVQVDVGDLFQTLTNHLSKAHTPVERLRAYLRQRVLLFHAQALRYGMAEEVRAELMARAERELRGHFEAELTLLEHLIRDGVAEGSLRPLDPHIGARILQSAIKGVTSDAPLPKDTPTVEAQADTFVTMVLNGLET